MLPYFYHPHSITNEHVTFDEETSKHIAGVLRMKKGEKLQITDGRGHLHTGEIVDDHRKKTSIQITGSIKVSPPERKITIAISLLKNPTRFEWFLEKATEIGVTTIIPLQCAHTEKLKFKEERSQHILSSALIQSRQAWMPVLKEVTKINTVLETENAQQKFIAHCFTGEKRELRDVINDSLSSAIILIGPEGDFTREEVESAVKHHYSMVSLGNTRLRTETAGIVAATLLCV